MSAIQTAKDSRLAASRLQYRLALVMVLVPVVGVITAIFMAWGHGVGRVELGLLIFMYGLGVVGVEVGFHRHFSHRAFSAHPALRTLLGILGSMAAQGPILFWVATHRRHHAHSDESGDPHSPHQQDTGPGALFRGLWHSHMGWLFAADMTDLGVYTPDLLRDRLVFRTNNLYPLWLLLGLALPTVLGGLLTSSWMGCLMGFIWGGLVRTFLNHHATWSVNSLCHVFGSRPFQTNDHSTNNAWLLLTSWGGSWHNNHHAFPTAAKNSFRWWQLDPCGWFISLFQWMGLAWDVKVPTRRMQDAFNEQRKHP